MLTDAFVLRSVVPVFCTGLVAQEKVVRLYEGPAPGSENWKQEEKENRTNARQTRVVFNVANPTLTLFPADPAKANGTAVIICPGGAFFALSIDSEGFDVARWLNAKGVTCFVLKYRLVECRTDDLTRELMTRGKLDDIVAPIVKLAMSDGNAAIGHVRKHAKEYGVNPDRIGIIGFSAGGTDRVGGLQLFSRHATQLRSANLSGLQLDDQSGGVPADARRCSFWQRATIRSGWRHKVSRFTRTGLLRRSPPSSTFIKRAVMALVCESKTCPPITG